MPLRDLKSATGFAASLLAVWCQILLLAMISLAPMAIAADPVGNVAICHADEGRVPAQQGSGHPTHDCALCVLCLSQALPLALLPPPPTLPAQHSVFAKTRDNPYLRAPPARLVVAAQPRGPPSLI